MRINLLMFFIIIESILLIGCTKEDNNVSKEVPKTVVEQEDVLVGEYGEVSEDFYFIIEDVFSLTEQENVVVVGTNRTSPIYSGMEVAVITSNGIKKTTIGGIETYEQGLVDGVPTGSNVGILLTGLTTNDIQVGDIIVMAEQVEEPVEE